MDTNIQKYMAFIQAIEDGSFTRAAETLNYSQSGISRMIHALEREWGVPLLERGHSGVHPTTEGLNLLPSLRTICNEYRDLQMKVSDLTGLRSGFIRIGTFSSVATHWLPNIIHEFQKDYPNINYEIRLGNYTEIESWILEGSIDCGFLLLPARSSLPELETMFLEDDTLYLVLPEGHPLTEYVRVPITLLNEYPFMLSKMNTDSEVLDLLNKYQISPPIRLTTWDDYAIMSMIEKGLGIGILSGLILKNHPRHVVLRELDVPAKRKIGFAYRNKISMSLAVKCFMQYLDFRQTDYI